MQQKNENEREETYIHVKISPPGRSRAGDPCYAKGPLFQRRPGRSPAKITAS